MKISYNDRYYLYSMFLVVFGIVIWGLVTKQYGSVLPLLMCWFSILLLQIIRSLLCYLNNKLYLSLQHLVLSFVFYTVLFIYIIKYAQELSQNEFSNLLGKLFNLSPDTAYYLILFMALLPLLSAFFISKVLEDNKEAIEKLEKERKEERNTSENLNSKFWKLSR